MNLEKQRAFIIHFFYYSIVLFLIYVFLRYVIYWIMPFILGFIIAFMLQPLIRTLVKATHLPNKLCAAIIFILFYATIGACVAYLCFKGYGFAKDFILRLPDLYQNQFEPSLTAAFASLETTLGDVHPDIWATIQELLANFNETLSSILSSASKGFLNILTNFAGSVPNGVVSFFFTILSSFFFSFDYRKITSFLMRQLSEDGRHMVLSIKSYITGSASSMLIAYMKLMMLTFIELSVGLSILKVDNAIIIAFLISLFDLLPVFGTGGIMIPWIIYVFFVKQTKLAVGLLIVYLIITLVRNIVEPKIVGKQLGMHPLLMLLCMYLGVRLFGFLGLFLMPMLLIILINLNDNGLIKLYK